ncbi:MAG: SH3 domain-containing protein [Chloroflexota bacterium]
MKWLRKIAPLFVLFCFATAVAAQDTAATCTAMIQQALGVVQDGCASTGRNQTCYGYVALSATARDGVPNFTFSHQGDLANLGDLATLRLSPFNDVDKTWGVALMKVQANLPDALPGQNVTFVLFGDVQVQNGSTSSGQTTVQVTMNQGATVRSGPSQSYAAIGSLANGDVVTATGRNADSSWIRIQLTGTSTQGWVAAFLLQGGVDLSQLPLPDGTEVETTTYKPMQAFYFKTGITKTDCAAAPPDGILVQTPEGAAKVNLRANDVDIQLGSTIFLQTDEEKGLMTITVIEGGIEVTADGKHVTVPAGSQVTIPITPDLHVAGRPNDVQPYLFIYYENLPISLLPFQIVIAQPLTEDQILTANLPTDFVPGASLIGIGADLSSLVNLSNAEFCATINQILPATGMSLDQYHDLLNHAMSGTIDPTAQALYQKALTKLATCS